MTKDDRDALLIVAIAMGGGLSLLYIMLNPWILVAFWNVMTHGPR